MDIRVTKPFQVGLGALGERLDDFDGINLRHKLGEHRGLVTRTGPDFQHAVRRLGIQLFGHEGNDVRLGNGLAITDGQGAVLVSPGLEFRRDEFVAGNLAQGGQHARVGDATPGT